MVEHFDGEGKQYDREYFAKLQKCFQTMPGMEESQNGFWKGWFGYYKSNGTERDFQGYADHWGGCYPGQKDPRPACNGHIEREQNRSTIGKGITEVRVME